MVDHTEANKEGESLDYLNRYEATRREVLKTSGAGIGAMSLGIGSAGAAADTGPTDENGQSVTESEEMWAAPADGVAYDIIKETDVPVPMRDGLDLAANVYRPDADGEYPVIIGFTPWTKDVYWRDAEEELGQPWPGSGVGYAPWSPPVAGTSTFEAEDPNYWVPQGYVIMAIDQRGTWRSPGEGGAGTGRDLYDAIEWAGEQEWSNGNVGLSGISALSINQYYVAARDPPHLKALCPWEGTAGDSVSWGGVDGGSPIGGSWDIPHRPAWEAPDDTNPPEDEDRSEWEWFEEVTQPVLFCGTWSSHGLFTRGDFRAFRASPSENKWLYNHGREKWAAFYDTEAQAYRKMFFDHFLKGTNDRILDMPPVRVEVRDNYWEERNLFVRSEDDFPLPDTEYEELYLDAADEELVEGSAPSEESTVSYDSTANESAVFDLTFEEPTSLIGYQNLKLWITPEDAPDGDIFVTVRKLDQDGNEVKFHGYGAPLYYPVALGMLRLSHRELDEERSTQFEPVLQYPPDPEEVTLGEPVECNISILPSGTFFDAGETLRVEVSGTLFGEEELDQDYPETSRGETPYVVDSVNEGEHTIHTGGDYASSLLIPKVPPLNEDRGKGSQSDQENDSESD